MSHLEIYKPKNCTPEQLRELENFLSTFNRKYNDNGRYYRLSCNEAEFNNIQAQISSSSSRRVG